MGWQQDDAVPQALELACPVMRRSACLQQDRDRLSLRKKAWKCRSRQPVVLTHPPWLFRYSNFENRLRDVDRNCRILHRGLLLLWAPRKPTRLWHVDADQVVGGVHPITST